MEIDLDLSGCSESLHLMTLPASRERNNCDRNYPPVLRQLMDAFDANCGRTRGKGNRFGSEAKKYQVFLYLTCGMSAYLLQRNLWNSGGADVFAGRSSIKEAYRKMRGPLGHEGVISSVFSGQKCHCSGDAAALRPSADYDECSGVICGLVYPFVGGIRQALPPADDAEEIVRRCSSLPLATYVECVCINGRVPIVCACEASDNTGDHLTVLSRWKAVLTVARSLGVRVSSIGADGAPPQATAHLLLAEYHAPVKAIHRFELRYLNVPPVSLSLLKVAQLKVHCGAVGIPFSGTKGSIMQSIRNCWSRKGEELLKAADIPMGCWFGTANIPFWTDANIVPIQDAVHITTKMRMRLKSRSMKIGSVEIRWDDLRDLCSDPGGTSWRKYRFLRAVDISGRNPMSFPAVLNMTSDEILNAAKGSSRFKGIFFYLSLMRMARISMFEGSLDIEKLTIAWELVFILRFWRADAMESGSLLSDFLTRNVYVCIELNAFSLSVLALEGDYALLSDLGSQTTERLYRSLRAMNTMLTDSVTFSMLEFHIRDRRRCLIEKLQSELMDSPSESDSASKVPELPALTDDQLFRVMENALSAAITFLRDIDCGLRLPRSISELSGDCSSLGVLVPQFSIPHHGPEAEEEVDEDPLLGRIDSLFVDDLISDSDQVSEQPSLCTDTSVEEDEHDDNEASNDKNDSGSVCERCKRKHPPCLCRFVSVGGERVLKKKIVKDKVDSSNYFLDRSRGRRVSGGELLDPFAGVKDTILVVKPGVVMSEGCYVLVRESDSTLSPPEAFPLHEISLGKIVGLSVPKFMKRKGVGRDVAIVHDSESSIVLKETENVSNRSWKIVLTVETACSAVIDGNTLRFPVSPVNRVVVCVPSLIAVVKPVYDGSQKQQIIQNFDMVLFAWNERRNALICAERVRKELHSAIVKRVMGNDNSRAGPGNPEACAGTEMLSACSSSRGVRSAAAKARKGFPKCANAPEDEAGEADRPAAILRAESRCVLFSELTTARQQEFVDGGGHCSGLGCKMIPDGDADFWLCRSCFRGFCISHDDYLSHVSGSCFDCNS